MAKYGKKNPYHPRYKAVDGSLVTQHPLYNVWCNMKDRCQNPDTTGYANYGGRGIKVCRRWDLSFEAFATDMGPKPSDEHSLDRRDNDKGYEPGNCWWATRSEQMLNRRLFKNSQSGATGVVRVGSRFNARMNFENVRYNLGSFNTAVEAEAARKRFQELLFVDREAALAMTERRLRFDSTTGVRGITRHTDGGFMVRKTVAKKRVYLGYRKTLDEAKKLWNEHN